MGGGQEGLEDAGDHQHRDSTREQADGFAAGKDKRVATAKHAGEEEAGGQAQTSAAGDEDAGKLECAVGRDETPNAERHVVLRACGGDDTHVHAVGEHEIDGSETSENARCEGVEANGNVVGHDEARGLRFDGEDRVGPHLVVFDFVDHLRTKHGVHELRARNGQQHSEERSG